MLLSYMDYYNAARTQGDPIGKLTRLARLANLIERVATQDESLSDPAALSAAMSKTLLLPPAIFPIRLDLPKHRPYRSRETR